MSPCVKTLYFSYTLESLLVSSVLLTPSIEHYFRSEKFYTVALFKAAGQGAVVYASKQKHDGI